MTHTTKIATSEKATATRVVELGVQDGDGEQQFVGVGRASLLARRNLIRTRLSRYCHRSVVMAVAVVPTLGRSKPATGSRKTTADTSSKSLSIKRPVTKRATNLVPLALARSPVNVGPFSRNVSPQLGGDKSTATEAGVVAKVKFCNEVSESRRDDRGLSTTAAVRSAVGT